MSAGALAHEGGSFGSAGFKAYTGDRVRGTNVLEGNAAVLVLVDFRAQVCSLFYKIDERGLGKITLTDLEKNLDDEAVKAFFESLEIGAVDAWTLFLSLDVDGDNLISIDEFMERCVQLRGPARSVDLYAIRRLNVKIRDEMRFLEDQQHRIMAHLGVKYEHHDTHEYEPTVFVRATVDATEAL
eukprot:s783_g3.t1